MLTNFFDAHFLKLISIANHAMKKKKAITCAQNNSNHPALGLGIKRIYYSSGAAVDLRAGDDVFNANLAPYGQRSRSRSRSRGRLLRSVFHLKQRFNAHGVTSLDLFYRHNHSLLLACRGSVASGLQADAHQATQRRGEAGVAR